MDRYMELSEQIEKLTKEEKLFVLWYLLPKFEEATKPDYPAYNMTEYGISELKTIEVLAVIKQSELNKACEQVRDVLTHLIW